MQSPAYVCLGTKQSAAAKVLTERLTKRQKGEVLRVPTQAPKN
jgi:hypothetical protein